MNRWEPFWKGWRWREHGLPALVFGGLWWVLIRHLAVEWSINPQYNYGWAVPFLCGYLVWERLQSAAAGCAVVVPSAGSRRRPGWAWAAFAVLALAYGPTRLVLEATPEWRVAQWALALETVGLTLLFLHWYLPAMGAPTPARALAFPIAYFLVAVPWLRPVEFWVVDGLTRMNVAWSLELLGLLGIPALQHGNVIEVSTGVVGVDEACSGIRSFQATLMISLYLGEVYRLRPGGRLGLVATGLGLAFGLNVGRTSLLTWVASRQGVQALGSWHDPAGISILVGCFLALWGIGGWLHRRATRRPAPAPKGPEDIAAPAVPSRPAGGLSPRVLVRLAVGLGVWIVAAELVTEWWFQRNERRAPQTANWHVPRPDFIPGAKDLGVPPTTREILRYSEGYRYGWAEPDGTEWQMIYARWERGRTWVKQVTRHAPTGCLRGIGWELVAERGVQVFPVGELTLGFYGYDFLAQGRLVHVYYCLWEDGARVQPAFSGASQWGRIQSALQGQRSPAMRMLELAVWGAEDADLAHRLVHRQLERLVRPAP